MQTILDEEKRISNFKNFKDKNPKRLGETGKYLALKNMNNY